jgi:hypothetical protein
MKKREKKLVLAKETVKSLEAGELENAVGAASVSQCDTWRYCPREPATQG